MMKNLLFFLAIFFNSFIILGQVQNISYTISPNIVEEDEEVTITIDGSSIDESLWGITNHSLYIWGWSYDLNDDNEQDCPTNGTWVNSDEANKLTYNSGDDKYTIAFIPQVFFDRVGIGKFGFLVKAKDGTGDKKSQDILVEVGAFFVTYMSPELNSITGVNLNSGKTVLAEINDGSALFELYANGSILDSDTTSGTYNYYISNITDNLYCHLDITQDGTTISLPFTIVVNQGAISESMLSELKDGINYNQTDATKATLVLTAPLKDFVYVAGSFNNWQPQLVDAMKTDPVTSKYWLEIEGLTPGEVNTYQYWVFETTPVASSPKVVVTADPYSTLVLSPYDDPNIPANSYPNMPVYPAGQEREVTVLQTGQIPYNWQVPNFAKPKKEDLVIYEVLLRDFDEDRTFQNLIDRIGYFKNLNINAIELMPVMEFEGNESWGYNPSFHLALDKFYGPADKLKQLVDLCHQNGIAVILDVVLNHAMGRNPMNRMWMVDEDNDGWGEPSSESPYFNQVATHSYSIGSDFNHSQEITKDYTKRVIEYWIEEFHIDGFRWDLTKGFTQNCTGSESCTNAYQQDRVDVLKEYADFSWSVDPTHYVIFEHLGTDNEEQEWANHRVGEGKGVMMWGKMTDPYNQLTMGFGSGSNIDRIGHSSRGFTDKRLVGYAESHDEERLMYKNLQFGNSANSNHDVKDLNIALSRMSALGAVTLTIPGPKMIWHFGDLGMDNSIFTCTDGSVDDPDCKLATKPQPQWVENWLGNFDRNQIYYDWAKLNALKQEETVFEGDYTIDSGNLTPRIYIWDDTLPTSELKNVVVLANFDVTTQSIVPDFPYTGTWYNLMDNVQMNVTSTTSPISLEAGEFRIYGNQSSTAADSEHELAETTRLYPNPTTHSFKVTIACNQVRVFDKTGKLVRSFDGNYNENTSFSVSGLLPALYFVQILTENGIANTKLVIE